ncbi:MAG: glycosyltransferase family 2 protein, partial [Actinobacteria bacterium]|nr:glycosyltransferase family 2 protein [Actinomycetota bacterium]
MEETPLVSVIIPTYNRDKYITLAIDSVLNQTFKDYEIIVIDDGSTDNTQIVLKPYRDKIIYIYQKNSGVSAARNAGIRIAKGEWLAFLDSDDEWQPTYLTSQMSRVKEIPEAVMHVTNSIMMENDGRMINTFEKKGLSFKFRQNKGLLIDDPIAFVIKYHITNLPCTIIKKNTFLETGMFDETINIAEDTDKLLRVALKGSLGIWNEPLVLFYRRSENNNSLSSCGFLKARENILI